MSHGVINAFDPTIAVGMIGAGSDLAHFEALEEGHRELRAELEAVVGQDAGGVAPKRHVLVHQDVRSTFGREGRIRDGVHVSTPAETVGAEQDVGVPARSGRKGAEVIDADSEARPRRKREGDDWPASGLSRSLASLALVAMAYPPAGGNAHANPPVEVFEQAEGFGRAQMTEGVGVAGLHDEGSHKHRHVDADGFVIEETSGPVRGVEP